MPLIDSMLKLSFIFLITILLLTLSVYATPGRLDSKGCHNSKSEGYHYHSSSSSSSSSNYNENNKVTTITPYNTDPIITRAIPPKKKFGDNCNLAYECESNYCVHSICRNETYFIRDGFCDDKENCLNSPNDCGYCNNNSVCDLLANENCKNTKDCSCPKNYICDLNRGNIDNNGCYKIVCGDGIVDSGETEINCCSDTKCKSSNNLFKVNFCEKSTQSCKSEINGYIKSILGIVIFTISLLFILLLKNRLYLKKSHKG